MDIANKPFNSFILWIDFWKEVYNDLLISNVIIDFAIHFTSRIHIIFPSDRYFFLKRP